MVDGQKYLTILLVFLTVSLVLFSAVPLLEEGKIVIVISILIGSMGVAAIADYISKKTP